MTVFTSAYMPSCRLTVLSADGSQLGQPYVRGGRVSWRAGGYPACTASLEVSDLDEGPLDPDDMLSPITGNRLRVTFVWRDDLDVERSYVLATLILTDCTESKPELTLELQASSYETLLQQDEFTRPHALFGAGGAKEELEELVHRTLPLVTVDWSGITDVDLDPTTTWDGDAWSCVETCLDALGAESYFDNAGLILHCRPASSVGAELRATLTEGRDIVGIRNSYSRFPSVAVVRGQDADGKQIVASASATGPMDPAGDYGRVVAVEQAPASVTTQAELQDAANAQLRRTARRSRTVVVDVLGGYSLRPGDKVRVDYLAGGTEAFIIRSVDFPLGVGVTSIELASLEVWDS